jgi:hypothetical protein
MACLNNNEIDAQDKYKKNKNLFMIVTIIMIIFLITFIVLTAIGFHKKDKKIYSKTLGIIAVVFLFITICALSYSSYEVYSNNSKIIKEYISCENVLNAIHQEDVNTGPASKIINTNNGYKKRDTEMKNANSTNVNVSGASGDVTVPEVEVSTNNQATNTGDYINTDMNGTDSMFTDSSQDISKNENNSSIVDINNTKTTTANKSAVIDNQVVDPDTVIESSQVNN